MSRYDQYGQARVIDGPQAQAVVPFVGMPRYGFMVELERHIDGGLLRRPKTVTDIYKVTREDFDKGELSYVGTLR